jgi:hypothetical protein
LSFFQLCAAASTIVGVEIDRTGCFLQYFVVLLLGCGFRRARMLLLYLLLLYLPATATIDTFFTQNLLAGVCDLSKNRLC